MAVYENAQNDDELLFITASIEHTLYTLKLYTTYS